MLEAVTGAAEEFSLFYIVHDIYSICAHYSIRCLGIFLNIPRVLVIFWILILLGCMICKYLFFICGLDCLPIATGMDLKSIMLSEMSLRKTNTT